MPAVAENGEGSKRFGTFAGVFTPSILTILGVVMYLRMGWVVGNAGLVGALLIVVISHVITLTTGLSISSLSTNRGVGAGGAYFIISRSLGAPVGAAIAIPLFLGQALSVSFYVVGFVETLQEFFPELPVKLLGAGVCALLSGISLKSAELAMRAQYLVMAAIVLSLISFGMGSEAIEPLTLSWEKGNPSASFSEVFAVFFPAVTGIMAGLGMSGDLKDARRSLPRGTLFAIGTGFVIYLAFPIWLVMNASLDELRDNTRVVWDVARFPALIYLGVWGATISSAIGSLLTAPRTAQALANDGLAPRILGKGSGPHNEPRVALTLTFAIALGGVLAGNLDVIARVLSMFFLATYGLTNLACGLERFAASPSFRPQFRVPAWLSLSGALACFYVMSIIDLPAMIVALLLCSGVFLWAERSSLDTTYGDARHGIWSAVVRTALFHLRRTEYHALNWRPNLVIMGGDLAKRPHLLELGSAIVQDRGIVTYFQLLPGTVAENVRRRSRLSGEQDARLSVSYPNVFFRAEIVQDVYEGTVQIAQSYGLGNFEANTVMLGWMSKSERAEEYVKTLRSLTALDRSLLLVSYDAAKHLGDYRHIQIWWGGLEGNGGLMLLIAFLLSAHGRFRGARISVVTVVGDEDERTKTAAAIAEVLSGARLDAQPRVLLRSGRAISEVMAEERQTADLAIIGIRLPSTSRQAGSFVDRMNSLLVHLPTTIMVRSARGFHGEPVLFDLTETTAAPPAVQRQDEQEKSASPAGGDRG